jgi:hypothetical protein
VQYESTLHFYIHFPSLAITGKIKINTETKWKIDDDVVAFLRRVNLQVDTSISEKHIISIFRASEEQHRQPHRRKNFKSHKIESSPLSITARRIPGRFQLKKYSLFRESYKIHKYRLQELLIVEAGGTYSNHWALRS